MVVGGSLGTDKGGREEGKGKGKGKGRGKIMTADWYDQATLQSSPPKPKPKPNVQLQKSEAVCIVHFELKSQNTNKYVC